MKQIKKPVAFYAFGSPATPAGGPTSEAGVPSRRFVKDIMKVGKYKHPADGWELDVKEADLIRWATKNSQMKGNGVDVEVVEDHIEKASTVRGYSEDMFVEGGTLFAVLEQRGDDGIRLAQNCKNVSVWIEPNFKDGTGNEYGDAITHIAFVTKPIVPGQSFAKPIAASFAGKSFAPLVFSMNGESDMLELKQLLKEISPLIGIADGTEVTPDDALAKLKAKIAADATASGTLQTQLQEATGKITTLTAQLQEKIGKTPDADSLNMAGDAADMRIDSLVSKGKITPAVAASLKSKVIGETGKRQPLALSATFSGRPTALIKDIIDALEQNEVVATGSQTGNQQGMGFSGGGSGGGAGNKNEPLSKEETDVMLRAAYGRAASK